MPKTDLKVWLAKCHLISFKEVSRFILHCISNFGVNDPHLFNEVYGVSPEKMLLHPRLRIPCSLDD